MPATATTLAERRRGRRSRRESAGRGYGRSRCIRRLGTGQLGRVSASSRGKRTSTARTPTTTTLQLRGALVSRIGQLGESPHSVGQLGAGVITSSESVGRATDLGLTGAAAATAHRG